MDCNDILGKIFLYIAVSTGSLFVLAILIGALMSRGRSHHGVNTTASISAYTQTYRMKNHQHDKP